MCGLWICWLVSWSRGSGLFRESPVVSLTVSVPAAGFVEGGVLLSSLLKESSFAPRGRWAVGIVAGLEVFIFVFLVWCDEFGRSR
jgi:hypothetical protein